MLENRSSTPPAGTLAIYDARYLKLSGGTLSGDLNLGKNLLIGGSGVTDILKLQGTTGNGTLTSPTIQALVGNNGGTTALTILNNGNVGIGTTSPDYPFTIVSSATGLFVVKTANVNDAFLALGKDSTGMFFQSGKHGSGTALPLSFWNSSKEIFRIDQSNNSSFINGNVGIGTTSPTNLLSLGGNAVRTFWMERHTTSNNAGNSLTIQAGGATVGATDKAGGQLILKPGLSTGTGESGITLQGCIAGSTSTSDNSLQDMVKVLGNKLGFFNVTPVLKQVVPTGSSADTIITALQNLGLFSQT